MKHPLHDLAVILAKELLSKEAQLLSVLIQMKALNLLIQFNYQGIFDYCVRELKLSHAQAYYFKSVALKSETVPELKEAIDQGELSLSQARRIVPVLTPENKAEWIEKAKSLPQADLERAVTEVNPRAHIRESIKPVAKETAKLSVPVDTTTEDNLKTLQDIFSQKKQGAVSLADVIARIAAEAREKHDPERKALRRKSPPISSGKLSPPSKGRQPLKASTKHEVVKRQGWQCNYIDSSGRRCTQRRWLDYHHVLEVSRGGTNFPQNLELLCAMHHKKTHTYPKESAARLN